MNHVPATPLRPEERFRRAGAAADSPTVGEFWSWAFSDLRSNTTRGVLAEFLVGRALGACRDVRAAWDDFDLLTADGLRVEVKASGYLQSWRQKRLSRINFGRLTGRTWNAETGAFGEAPELRADVYVFAVQTCQAADRYDPLDLDAWSFFVLSRAAIEKARTRSISIGTIVRLGATEVSFSGLTAAVLAAAPPRSPLPAPLSEVPK